MVSVQRKNKKKKKQLKKGKNGQNCPILKSILSVQFFQATPEGIFLERFLNIDELSKAAL